MVIHEALVVAVHEQPDCVVRAICPEPPVGSNESLVGDTV
jgi:hypothetical protein